MIDDSFDANSFVTAQSGEHSDNESTEGLDLSLFLKVCVDLLLRLD